MKLLVLYNMSSGLRDAAVFDYIRMLMDDGDEVTIRSSDGTTDIRTFLFDADDYDAVAVSGGDGTIASIVHFLANTGIPVIPFPGGTANLLSMNLHSPTESHALVNMTRNRRVMDFDIGEIEFPDHRKYGFAIMAGAGYDAAIMQGAESGKKIFGPVAYLTSALANVNSPHSEITLDIDGETIKTSGVGVLIVNFSKIQFDLPVVHDNLPCDGIFDIVVFHTRDALGLIPDLFAAILDRGGDYPNRSDVLQTMRGRNIRIDADPPLPVQFDGEVIDRTTPFKVRMLPAGARFIVSDDCVKAYG